MNFDTVIIGSGLLGMLTARELMREGRSVALFDRGQPGMESSWAGGGILSPLYPWRSPTELEDLMKWGQKSYPSLVEELFAETGIDPQWRRSGLLILEEDEAEAERAMQWSKRTGMPCEPVSTEKILELEPLLDSDWRGQGLWFPQVAQVRNPALIDALVEVLRTEKAVFHHEVTVDRLVVERGSVKRIESSAGNFSAADFVISAGAWSRQLLAGVGVDIPVRPVRGQMLCLRAESTWPLRILLRKGVYIIPRSDGHVLVGSTVEDVGFDKSTDDAVRQDLIESASRMVPGVAKMPLVRHWSGLRPGIPGGIPYICACPGISNLYLNTGHDRAGITLAPASARMLTDLMLSREPIVPVEPFSIDSRAVQA